MITERYRQEVYTKVFRFLIHNRVCMLPVDLGIIAQLLHVDLIPLSVISRQAGISEESILSDLWRNEDGCVHCFTDKFGNKKYRIAYNDYKLIGRIRFTTAEELSHIILEHTNCNDFNMFNQQYSEKKYQHFDESARIAAGILLCPPQFYYNYGYSYSVDELADLCNITPMCARTRIDILNKWEYEITSNPLYLQLPTFTDANRQIKSVEYIPLLVRQS